MKKQIVVIVIGLLFPCLLLAQAKQTKYDLLKDRVLYTVGYSHLDTEWNWDYPTTINEYIKNIMTENFYLFEKYPQYVFNFTGSRRYGMMKEYYPDLYQKVKDYIHQGRWFVSGSSVDEGEVNISSPESVIRQVLYGNKFFKDEFGKESMDYMLPDCFGFMADMPSVWNHCGLLGFSTQKLTWHSAAGVPFNVGIWNGPDGKGIIAALNATNYVGNIVPRLDLDPEWNARLDQNQKKYGISFDYRYYGVGDEGGAPRESDVINAIGSLNNKDSKLKVLLTSSDQMYKDITPEVRKKLPVYVGDLLLIEHSAGSMTSESFMKRINRKNELLAQNAEQLASIVDWTGNTKYPFTKLNNAWNLVLGSQFHDILPGTAIPRAYEYAWNDEFIAANGFSSVLTGSMKELSTYLNTQGKGRSIIVYNPVAQNREDVVNIEMEYNNIPENVQVFDGRGNAVPTQITGSNGNKLKIIFLAKIPSMGCAVFDVREASAQPVKSTGLSAKNNTMENAYYKVTVGNNGDITSIYDKQAKKELLASPASLEFRHEAPTDWPAWNMDWNDRKKPALGYLNEDASVRVVEQGPVRVAIEVKRNGMNSSITQIVSLAAGEAGKRVEISNVCDWQSQGVSLKADFPLTVNNPQATYNLGVGAIQRGNNDSLKFEVPSKEWFDLTNPDNSYGVTILEDCKFGSDKPSDNTLRLTLLYTPAAQRDFQHQRTQDWGEHHFRYGVYGHQGSWQQALSPWQGKMFNQPLLAFETTDQSNGAWGKEISFLSANNPQVGVMAFKKMENGDYYVVRVNELSGKDLTGIKLTVPGKITDAYEINGQEQRIGNAGFSGNGLNFDLSHFTIRSFAVKLAQPSVAVQPAEQVVVSLPYNQDVMSYDNNRDDGRFSRGSNIPAELVPDVITSEGINFKMGNRADEQNNAVTCQGQEITLPDGNYSTLYLIAAAGNRDTQGDFVIGNQTCPLKIQRWEGIIGQWYDRRFAQDGITVINVNDPFVKKDNIAWFASHIHQAYPSKNVAYNYCYLYKYSLPIPSGAKKLVLPNNRDIKILAITIAKEKENVTPLQPLYDDFQNDKSLHLVNLK